MEGRLGSATIFVPMSLVMDCDTPLWYIFKMNKPLWKLPCSEEDSLAQGGTPFPDVGSMWGYKDPAPSEQWEATLQGQSQPGASRETKETASQLSCSLTRFYFLPLQGISLRANSVNFLHINLYLSVCFPENATCNVALSWYNNFTLHSPTCFWCVFFSI